MRFLIFLFVLSNVIYAQANVEVSGELKKWHKITLTFDGPEVSENDDVNPFLNNRLQVIFSKGEKSFSVPGYFAADGDAANTSASSGNKWRVHFAPEETGTWNYLVSFKQGENIAVSDDINEGIPYSPLDSLTGTFDIDPSDKTGRDFRSKGRLKYIGERYLQFAETGEYFLKCGADAPENFLAYQDFDGNFKTDGNKDHLIKTWSAHVQDWNEGDPTWQNGKGKGIIGAINYLASEGMNVFSFLTMNINGDDRNVFPYITYNERVRFDVSRLEQWEIIFEHADKLGMYLHFKTQETENEMLLDNGNTGLQRKLYYRELIARYSHHLALNWNLGEENGALGNVNQSTAQRKAMAEYFYTHDPYQHNIVIHNGKSFDDLLGSASKLTGASVQTNRSDFANVHGAALNWINKSKNAGKPWVVAVDEPGDAQHALVPDSDDPTHDNARKNGLWGAIIAGSAGLEWYFGYQHDHSDLTCEDWRSRDLFWDQCKIALDYIKDREVPFWEMGSNDNLAVGDRNWCLSKDGEYLLVYAADGGEVTVDLSSFQNINYAAEYLNPFTGQTAFGMALQGGGSSKLIPPTHIDDDYLAYLRVVEDDTPPTVPENFGGIPLNDSSIKLTWEASADAETGIGGYLIYRNSEYLAAVSASDLEYTDSMLIPLTEYLYKISALNGAGLEGETTAEISVMTLADETDPELISAFLLGPEKLQLTFSETMDEISLAEQSNYSISGDIQIIDVTVGQNNRSVLLSTSAHQTEFEYTVTVNNLKDLSGRLISASANSLRYKFIDDQIWILAENATLENGASLKMFEGSLGNQVAYSPNADGEIIFNFNTVEKAVWYAWGRFYFAGSDNDPNSFFLSVDESTQLKFGNNKDYFNIWHWDGDGNVENGTPVKLNIGELDAGEHTLILKCREPIGSPGTENIMIDVLFLTSDPDLKPDDSIITDVTVTSKALPKEFHLFQNYPNPFNPVTNISYSIPRSSQFGDYNIQLNIYDVLGRHIKTLVDEKQKPGYYSVSFDASDYSSGIYLYRLVCGKNSITKKIILTK